MPTLEVTLPPLHDGQRQIAASGARFKLLVKGRRWGGSRLAAVLCLASALEGGRAWWVWPSYTEGAIGWRLLKRLARQVPRTEPREGDRMVVLATGGTVQVRSADDPDRLRGEGLDFLAVDEVAHMHKWDEVWDQALRPTLSDRQGQALLLSTPRGFNHFYELWQAVPGDAEWARWQFPTWTNPHIAAREIEAARQSLHSLVFRQEYGAEFVQLAGALFRREWFDVIDEPLACRGWARYWDLAVSTKTSADYTVGARCGFGADGSLVIADVVRGRWEWPDAVRAIATTAIVDGTATSQGIEDTGTQKGMYQQLMREPRLAGIALRPVPVHKDKMVRASAWLSRAEHGKVVLVRGEWNRAFLDEVCAFPESTHDDQVDAVSGAVQMLAQVSGPMAVLI